jgi:hypothetical protein
MNTLSTFNIAIRITAPATAMTQRMMVPPSAMPS